jgi:hypothetical protein
MAIINSYPEISTLQSDDLLLVCDMSVEGNPTKTTSVADIVALIPPLVPGGGTMSDWKFTGTPGPSVIRTVTNNDQVTFRGGDKLGCTTAPGVLDLTIDHDATTRTDTTSTESPIAGGTFTCIDSVTQDATGHPTAVNVKTVTLPASLGGVTSVNATNSTFISGAATPSPITTTGTLEYSLSATGSPSSKTYLRGDNAWSDPSKGAIPTYFQIKTQVTGVPVFNNQGNITFDTQDFGGTIGDWTFSNESTPSELIYRVNFSGRTDTFTNYMVNFVFESVTEDSNGNEVPAIGYVKDKNATFFEFVLLPANLTGKAAGLNMLVNFQIYK